jgi:hypothetical protein
MTGRRVYIAFLLATLGCGTTVDYAPLNEPEKPMTARSANDVEVFVTQVPTRPYAEVGLLDAHQTTGASLDGTEEILAAMKADAAARGCDALVIHPRKKPNPYTSHTGLRGYTAACVLYTAAPPAPPPKAAPPTPPPPAPPPVEPPPTPGI